MRIRVVLFFLITSAAVLAIASPSEAAWIENGTPICTAVRWQEAPTILADGEGGAFIVWKDQRYPYVYAQRIDAHGNPMWAEDGVPVTTSATSWKHYPQTVSDGAGGIIIVWQDGRDTHDDIWAQRLDPDGNLLWGNGGTEVCTASGEQRVPVAAADGAGGCIVAWVDYRTTIDYDVYAQKLDDAGSPLWTPNGEAICTATGHQDELAIASNGVGMAVITWDDNRGADTDTYAQLVKTDGNVSWTVDGEPVSTYTNSQYSPRIIWDDSDFILIYWYDSRNSPGWDLYAQLLDQGGSAQWTADGKGICTRSADMQSPKAVSDGTGGFFFAWGDDRNGPEDVYIQRVAFDGAEYWPYDGIPICEAANIQSPMGLIPGDDGNLKVVWTDQRSGDFDIYMQSVDRYGGTEWAADGIPIVDLESTEHSPKTVTDGRGGFLVAWKDFRAGNFDIFAQRIDRDGNWGVPEPMIRAIRDVPGDQGGQVNVSWNASQYDPDIALITHYTVWRAIDPEAAMMMVASGARILDSEAEMPGIDELDELAADHDLIRTSLFGTTDYYWTLAGGHDAYYLTMYSLPTSTLFDSTAVSDEYHYFQVIAHTEVPTIFFVSPPDSGYSVDNLAPCAPLPIAGEQLYAPEGLELTWAPSSEPDFDCYHIYRDIGPSFDPSPGNLMTTTCDTLLLDGGWSWDSGFCYKVAAVDVHGNESEYAMLCIEQVTGDDPMPLPDATFLAQNYPNPFNPSTNISFGIKDSGHVKLSIFDAAGRLVRVLVDGNRPAGQYTELWDGSMDGGGKVSSGVYFYRLKTKEFTETKKMILLR